MTVNEKLDKILDNYNLNILFIENNTTIGHGKSAKILNISIYKYLICIQITNNAGSASDPGLPSISGGSIKSISDYFNIERGGGIRIYIIEDINEDMITLSYGSSIGFSGNLILLGIL